MGTGADTFAASYAKLAVVVHDTPGAVIAHFGWTDHDTTVAIDALVFHYMNNRP
jgi:hypothetical protein